jgi:hypothetical protein
MKQHKSVEEKQAKKIQQHFGKKRAQHRKRALDYLSMANFVDKAFGLEKSELEKQISSNGYHTSSSTSPQVNRSIYIIRIKYKLFFRLYQHHLIN